MPGDTAPPADPADERLVADTLAAIDEEMNIHHRHGHDRMDLALRAHALQKLPAAVTAQLLRQEAADALNRPDRRTRPDRLFVYLMTHESLPVTFGSRTAEAEDGTSITLTGGPGRVLILPAPEPAGHPTPDVTT